MKKLADFEDADLRIFDRPPLTPRSQLKDVYLIGICGTGMGSLAGLFAQDGLNVRGSDAKAYPPMSTRLESQGIEILEGYATGNIEYGPSLTVVGNACTPTHPEASLARDRRFVQASFPQALSEYFIQDKRSVVIAGTHGKTTTTALLSHIFVSSGLDPGFLVGGVLKNYDASCRIGGGDHFVVEGDEYDSAYFDKRPKFLHYKPFYAVVTSLEYDHADIFDDLDDYYDAFAEFAGIVHPNGLLVLNGDDELVRSLHDYASTNVVTYGLSPNAFVSATNVAHQNGQIEFNLVVQGKDRGLAVLPMCGEHNLYNALAACAIAIHAGVSHSQLRNALASFQGIRRRQELIGRVNDIDIIDDFAHHPTAVRETIQAIKAGYPGRRTVAIFEPRSNSSRRKNFENLYVDAFEYADVVLIKKPPFRHNDTASNFMDIDVIVSKLSARGINTSSFESTESLMEFAVEQSEQGDVVLIMSNGGFDGIHGKIIRRLGESQKIEGAS